MKTKFICILLLLSLLGGCRLAVEAEELPSGRDRLIGVFVTPEHLDLFNAEAFFNDHVNEILEGKEIKGDTSAYQNVAIEAFTVDGKISSVFAIVTDSGKAPTSDVTSPQTGVKESGMAITLLAVALLAAGAVHFSKKLSKS